MLAVLRSCNPDASVQDDIYVQPNLQTEAFT